MHKVLSFTALTAVASLALGTALQASIAQGPPSPGTLLADGYVGSIGTVADLECNLYVTEAGTGGDEVISIPDVGDFYVGDSAQITKVSPSGEKTVVASGLWSAHQGDGFGYGVIDVALLDGDLYYLQTGTAEPLGSTNGVYRIEDDGSSTLVADIGAFNDDNPVEFPDAIPGGNPYSITPYDGGFVVADGNYNRLLKVELDGSIEIIISLDNVVPTGVAVAQDGSLVWAQIGPFPHDPADGKVVQLTGTGTTTLASGLANVIDVQYGADDRLYALTLGDSDPTGEAPGVPFTGRISLVNADGTFSPIVEGFMFATSMEFCGGDAYVTGLTGETRIVADIGSLEPIPTPTAVPPATPTTAPPGPPATGTGVDEAGSSVLWFALAGLAVALAGSGLVVATRRRA
jgi:hypothetical protein